MALDICGDGAIFMPETGCDDCEQFTSRLEAVEDVLDTKSPILAAGDGITLTDLPDGRVEVASEGEAYTAGDGIEISTANVISALRNPTNTYTKAEVDENLTALSTALSTQIAAKQDNLTAGDGIDITNNVVSAERNATNTYTKAEVDTLIAELEHVHMVEVATLPATGEANIIYLVPKTGGGYEMWVWANNEWKSIGGTDIDLSNYATKAEAVTAIGMLPDGQTYQATRGDGATFNFAGYVAADGLGQLGNVIYTSLPRTLGSATDSLPRLGAVNVIETAGVANGLPTENWFHVYSGRSIDQNYATQVAVSMTSDEVYVRRFTQGAWGAWYPLYNVYGVASQSANGLMSATDKAKMDGVSWSANRTVFALTEATYNFTAPGTGSWVDFNLQAPVPDASPGWSCAGIVAFSLGHQAMFPSFLTNSGSGYVQGTIGQAFGVGGTTALRAIFRLLWVHTS